MEKLSTPSITPAMGPFPLHQDVLGMLPAIALLDRSLDKGIHLGIMFSGERFEKQCQ